MNLVDHIYSLVTVSFIALSASGPCFGLSLTVYIMLISQRELTLHAGGKYFLELSKQALVFTSENNNK